MQSASWPWGTRSKWGMWLDTESEGGTCMLALVQGIDREVPLALVRPEIWRVMHKENIPDSRKLNLLLEGSGFILRVINILLTIGAFKVQVKKEHWIAKTSELALGWPWNDLVEQKPCRRARATIVDGTGKGQLSRSHRDDGHCWSRVLLDTGLGMGFQSPVCLSHGKPRRQAR